MFPTSDGALGAYSFRTSLTKEYAVKLFDSCKEVTSFGLSAIGMICADMDCTYVVSGPVVVKMYVVLFLVQSFC